LANRNGIHGRSAGPVANSHRRRLRRPPPLLLLSQQQPESNNVTVPPAPGPSICRASTTAPQTKNPAVPGADSPALRRPYGLRPSVFARVSVPAAENGVPREPGLAFPASLLDAGAPASLWRPAALGPRQACWSSTSPPYAGRPRSNVQCLSWDRIAELQGRLLQTVTSIRRPAGNAARNRPVEPPAKQPELRRATGPQSPSYPMPVPARPTCPAHPSRNLPHFSGRGDGRPSSSPFYRLAPPRRAPPAERPVIRGKNAGPCTLAGGSPLVAGDPGSPHPGGSTPRAGALVPKLVERCAELNRLELFRRMRGAPADSSSTVCGLGGWGWGAGGPRVNWSPEHCGGLAGWPISNILSRP